MTPRPSGDKCRLERRSSYSPQGVHCPGACSLKDLEVCATSAAALRRVQRFRSKAELEAARHWSAGGITARRQGKSALSVSWLASLRQRKFRAFHFARADRRRVRVREGNAAEAPSLQSGRLDDLRFRPVRLGRTRRGRRHLPRPRLRQGEKACPYGENRPPSHIHTEPVDALTIDLPYCASSRKNNLIGSRPCPRRPATSSHRDASRSASPRPFGSASIRIDLRPNSCAPRGFL